VWGPQGGWPGRSRLKNSFSLYSLGWGQPPAPHGHESQHPPCKCNAGEGTVPITTQQQVHGKREVLRGSGGVVSGVG
jgi:hypothetical protein